MENIKLPGYISTSEEISCEEQNVPCEGETITKNNLVYDVSSTQLEDQDSSVDQYIFGDTQDDSYCSFDRDDSNRNSPSIPEIAIQQDGQNNNGWNKILVKIKYLFVVDNHLNKQKYVRYLGIYYNKQYLQQRNKNPILYLNCFWGTVFLLMLTSFCVFVIGTNFQKLYVLIFGLQIVMMPVQFLLILRSEPFQAHWIVSLITIFNVCNNAFSGLCINFTRPPFNSLSFSLVGLYLFALFLCMAVASYRIPNNLHWYVDNYQMRYYGSIIAHAFINATALIDVFSDLVMVINIFRSFQGSIVAYAICLFILCGLDFAIVLFRLRNPTRAKAFVHIIAVVLEVAIITLSSIIAKLVGDLSADWDMVILVYLSISTTVVNFVHHVFLMYQYYGHERTLII